MTKGASQSPVVAFGGSYGGMLAAWMRAKYPQIIVGYDLHVVSSMSRLGFQSKL